MTYRVPLPFRAPALLALVAGCSAAGSSPSNPSEDIGELTAALSIVPSAVACIDLEFASGERVLDKQTTVTPRQAGANLHFTGLPLGSVVLTGLAYSLPCAQVTSSTSADYATDSLTVTVSPGVTENVSLQFHTAGSVVVGVGFDDAGVAPWLVASTGSATFSALLEQTSPPQTFTFTNQGSVSTKTLTTAISNNSGSEHFLIPAGGDTCTGKAIPVNGTCSVTVEFDVGGCQPAVLSSSLTVGDGTTSGAVALQGDNEC